MMEKDVGRSSRELGMKGQRSVWPVYSEACLWVGFIIKNESWGKSGLKECLLRAGESLERFGLLPKCTDVIWKQVRTGWGLCRATWTKSLVTWPLERSRYCSESGGERFKVLILMKSHSKNVSSEMSWDTDTQSPSPFSTIENRDFTLELRSEIWVESA